MFNKKTAVIEITLRTQKNIFHGSDTWQEVDFKRLFDPTKTAILICDMWDQKAF